MSRKFGGLVLLLMVSVLAGCLGGKSIPGSHTISGRITEYGSNQGIVDVVLSIENGTAATTDENGNWMKNDVEESVYVIPSKDGWSFFPRELQAEPGQSNIDFYGARNDRPEVIASLGPEAEEVFDLFKAALYGDADEADREAFAARFQSSVYFLSSEKSREDMFDLLVVSLAVGIIPYPDVVETITAAEFGNNALVEVLTTDSDGDELIWFFQLTRSDNTSDWLVSALTI